MSPPDYGMAYTERAEIYDLIRDAKITGFAIVSGTATVSGPVTRLLLPGRRDQACSSQTPGVPSKD